MGFVRGVAREGFELEGARCLVVGTGGVGSAIAARLATGAEDLCRRCGDEAGNDAPLLQAARAWGCPIQVGTEMLFEQIPLYLEFFGFGQVTPDELRAVAMLA
jgi:shikimate 5-dehydrogenase